MKKLITLSVLLFTLLHVKAQTWDEWFKQRKTQIKYLHEQIIALGVYIEQAQKGYEIARRGLDFVNSIKRGEFDLHDAFFQSLKTVHPRISNYSRIADILSNHYYVVNNYHSLARQARNSQVFTEEELSLFDEVFDNLSTKVKNTTEELIQVITSGKLEMKDDGRLRRIDELYAASATQRTDFDKMARQLKLSAFQRLKERVDINSLQKIFELP